MTDAILLTPEEAADQLSISRSSLYLLLTKGELESVRIGRSRRITKQALLDYVERLLSESEISA